jgi:hypothetical protein
MPSFVNMASLTKLASLTGNEEFQVSATQKVTAQQIAELSLSQMLSGFSTLKRGKPSITANIALLSAIQILYKLSSNGSVMSISNGTDKFGTVTYSGSDAVGILFDVKASKYYTRSGATTPTSYTDEQWITWLQAGNVYEMRGSTGVADPIQIHDFAEVSAIDNWPTPKDGLIIPFTTDSGVLNKPGNESEYVGIIICEVDTQQTGRAEVIAYGSGTGSCYIGLLDWASISIEWMVNKLSVSSKKLSAFTGTAIGNYVQSMGDSGDLFPFTTVNANKTAANQFPANGAWSGFVTIGDGGGINIIAFKSTTDPKAEVYVGRCGGSSTQWTAVGGGGGVTAPVQIAEYGAFYDYTELNNVPAGSVTAWFAPGSNVDGDLGPFKGMSEHTEGIYIAIRGSEDSTRREGIMVAYRADDTDKGIAYAHVQGSPGNGGIKYATDWMTINSGASSGGIAPGTVIFNDEFSFDGYTNANPGQLSLLQPIPLGSIVTFIGSYYFGPPAEEILLSPESHTWSLTVALPTGASSIAHYLKDMLVVQNPDTNLVVARQSAIYKIDAKNLVNGKISTIDMYATGALLSDMYLTIDQIIYVAQV